MNIELIKSFDIPDAWYRSLRRVLEKGHIYTIDRGSFIGHLRKELDFVVIHITNPGSRPLVPDIPPNVNTPVPTSMEFVNKYMEKIFTPFKTKNESYTYGERLTGEIDQIKEIIKMYKDQGHGTNQGCMEVAMPIDILLGDPPCLRLIDTRIRHNKLHFFMYFRSWDLWSGLPTNLAGLQLLKEYISKKICVDDGELIAFSKGLHLYDFQIPFAKERIGITQAST